MSNERITELPAITSASLSDIMYLVTGYVSPSNLGTSVQATLQQVSNLMLSQTVLNYAGNPNGFVAGSVYQLCWDKTNNIMYVCTTTGSTTTAVWTAIASSAASIIDAAHGGTGVANPTAHGIAVAEGASNFTFKVLTDGQVLIGVTGSDPVPANLTAGAGISITNGAGTITIAGTGSGIGWNEVTGVTQAMVADTGYVVNNAGLVTLTLPTTAAFGTAITILGKGAGGWIIAQNSGQSIQVGSVASTIGVGGSVASTNRFDSIELICTTANTIWTTQGGVQGALTIV